MCDYKIRNLIDMGLITLKLNAELIGIKLKEINFRLKSRIPVNSELIKY